MAGPSRRIYGSNPAPKKDEPHVSKDPLKDLMDEMSKDEPKNEVPKEAPKPVAPAAKPAPPKAAPSTVAPPPAKPKTELEQRIESVENLIKATPDGAKDGRHDRWNKALVDLKAKKQ